MCKHLGVTTAVAPEKSGKSKKNRGDYHRYPWACICLDNADNAADDDDEVELKEKPAWCPADELRPLLHRHGRNKTCQADWEEGEQYQVQKRSDVDVHAVGETLPRLHQARGDPDERRRGHRLKDVDHDLFEIQNLH